MDTIEARAVKIAARIMVADGLCRYESTDQCRRVWPSEQGCEKCIRSWLQLEAGTRECQVFFFQNAQEYVLLAFFQNPETSLYSLKDCAKRILRKLPELGGLQGSAAIGRSHRGVGELYSATS